MNAERLRGIVDLILAVEGRHSIQNILNQALQNLTNIAQNPANQQFQNDFSANLERLRTGFAGALSEFTPAQLKLLYEIGAKPYFIDNFPSEIGAWMQENPLTPSVTQQKLQTFVSQRNEYIQRITQLRDGLEFIGMKATALESGDAELAILLPRELFANEFDELVKKLRDVNRVIRAFSEVATGSVEPITVRQISTSDPQFFLGMSVVTLAALGRAITWALDTWKKVEEIRNLRAQTKKLATPFAEAEGMFEKKIGEIIQQSVAKKIDELLGAPDGLAGRVKEQRVHLEWALETLLAYIERGVTLEVTFKLPAPSPGEETASEQTEEAFQTLQQIAPHLTFPKIEENPILSLPSSERFEA